MRNIVLAVLLGGALWALQLDLGQVALSWPLLDAVFRVGVGILATACLAGGASAWVVVAGALSPLAIPLTLWAVPSCPSCPWMAVALVWSLPRYLLARSVKGAWSLALVGLVASSVAGWAWMRFHPTHAPAAALLAGSVLSLGTLFAATETPISAALIAAASRLSPSPAKEALIRAASSHREQRSDRFRDVFPGPWSRLVQLADLRATLTDGGAAPLSEARVLDERILAAATALCGSGQPNLLDSVALPATVVPPETDATGIQAAPEAPMPSEVVADKEDAPPVTEKAVEASALVPDQI